MPLPQSNTHLDTRRVFCLFFGSITAFQQFCCFERIVKKCTFAAIFASVYIFLCSKTPLRASSLHSVIIRHSPRELEIVVIQHIKNN